MIELLKVWVTNITIAIFFITAVEMILPDNNMKKYAKFVLGLMLIVVIIKPIIKIFDKNFDLNSYSNKATSYIEGSTQPSDMKKYKDINIVNTTENFKKNLQKECITNLEQTYPENKYNADVDVVYDSKNGVFNINRVKIDVVDSGVQSIKSIKIDTQSVDASNNNVLTNTQGKQIKKFLSNKLKISDDVITVYKVNS
ncbi:stage III sporulation protein AF [Clostridium estertheticum]|uniref:Stage III sporulation protein AF n=2 Tax=Clostridium estertheticum TaxID=238834 RepID=A0A1J0GI37_9CLOT|nr:stage III sporulation protein AF [Clostridium estertheticum]APC41017.1 stage III sporulation protein AF [Clostridium estertheticum subsp. estertheticum]MBU3074082.1 stage III sporulation protein AF [Clostridium estertheticum]MBU3164176.1 stage III sporulation protein AF [Clostridium estertheticum]MBZ9617111.1 stage III sporulation protein AF [Clostridium estertheticum subsp. laramiense]NNU76135.1 stage III sporulation protein AF [Clostridium estertheticum]